ncbi:hypothetical protein AYO22_04095 [Fonsecaea multimorphosa]|nr:hypothetical protein AYO22_04095 [Fonsecaea multimorphosa]
MSSSRAESMVIVVMGVTGSGKSSIISLLADQDAVQADTLADTVNVKVYSFTDEFGGTVFLVDTPGFDDTTRSDAEILREISYFLAAFANRSRLVGLIYLHRISDARMPGSAVKNLRMFKGLCGQPNYKHVVLVTTMWSEMERNGEGNVARQRLSELQSTYWADMIQSGAMVMKHNGQQSSALNIIHTLTKSANSYVTLAIQRQLVDEGRTLDDTDAGRVVCDGIQAAKSKFELEFAELRAHLDEAEQDEDEKSIDNLRNDMAAVAAQAKRRARDGHSLEVSIQQLAKEHHQWYHDLVASLQEQVHGGAQTPRSVSEERSARAQDHNLKLQEKELELEERERGLEKRELELNARRLELDKRESRLGQGQQTGTPRRKPLQHRSRSIADPKRERAHQVTSERKIKLENKQEQNVGTHLLAMFGYRRDAIGAIRRKREGQEVKRTSTSKSLSDFEHRSPSESQDE